MNHADVLTWLVERTELDCVLVAGCYSLLDVQAADRLFPACKNGRCRCWRLGSTAAASSPTRAPEHTWTMPLHPVRSSSESTRIRSICDGYGVPLAAAALQFVLADPAVTAAVVGQPAREA